MWCILPRWECHPAGDEMSQPLTERYDERIAGILSCYDRVVITGTLPGVCYADGMTRFLQANRVRIFDYPQFAVTLRDRVRERAASLAAEAGVTIEHIGKAHIRKEDVVAQVLKQRGDRPGLVHILSAMEVCDAYKPWHDKQTHRTSLRPDNGKCLHYYFDFQDARLGLIYLRVPTWAPFRLQFYCNGHSWLARKLTAQGIGYTMADMPSCGSMTGHVPRNWRIPSRPTNCIARWTATPRSAARCPMHSDSPTIGARCRWNTPPTWRSDPPPRSVRFMGSSSARPCSASKPSRSPASSAGRSRHCWRRRSARSSPPASKEPA